MPDDSFADALNEQIANEFAAREQYMAAAVYYDAQTLPRLAAFFYRQALEERGHAMMMVQYLFDTGEAVHIPDIKSPRDRATPTADAPVKMALEQEKRVERGDLRPVRAWRARSRTSAPSSSCSGSSRSRSRRWP